jgi:ATP-dependent DNA helicase DinG
MNDDIESKIQYVKSVLTPGSGVVQEARDEQIRMAGNIGRVLFQNNYHTVIAEGGTGLGKSFAYLVPIFALLEDDLITKKTHRIFVTTGTKDLQDQLIKKDIPYLMNHMKTQNVKPAVLKGKSTYLCHKNFHMQNNKNKLPSPFVDQVLNYMRMNPGTPIERNHIKMPFPGWGSISCENCADSSGCEFRSVCRPITTSANLVVTNHAMLGIMISKNLIHMAPYAHNIVVIDEAHDAYSNIRGIIGSDVTTNIINRFTAELQSPVVKGIEAYIGGLTQAEERVPPSLTRTLKICEDLHRGAEEIRKLWKKIESDLKRLTHTEKENIPIPWIEERAKPFRTILNSMAETLDDLVTYRGLQEILQIKKLPEAYKEYSFWRTYLVNKCNELRSAFYINTEEISGKEVSLVYYKTSEYRGNWTLSKQFYTVKKYTEPYLKDVVSIHTSATLAQAVAKKSPEAKFQHYTGPMGISTEGLYCGVFESPYDIHTNSVLYMPRDIPNVVHRDQDGSISEGRERWITAVGTEICRLVRLTNGNAFVLFASRADLVDVEDSIGWDIPNLLSQRDVDGATLRESYMKTANATIFGLKTFWQGVDIKGDKLKQVIIVRVPFPPQNDPYFQWMRARANEIRLRSSFSVVDLPHVTTMVKQGFGRLIRSADDRGILTCLDARMWGDRIILTRKEALLPESEKRRKLLPPSRHYGASMIRTLGYTEILQDFSDVEIAANTFFGNSS